MLAIKLKDYKLLTWDPIGPQIRRIDYNENRRKFNVLSIWLEKYGIPQHIRLGVYNREPLGFAKILFEELNEKYYFDCNSYLLRSDNYMQ